MAVEAIRIGTKALRPHKALHSAFFEMRSVLTNDPFDYVDLWLRRQHQDDALFYWRQAKAFYLASQNLTIESSPLVLYYCFMNAAKALLTAKGVTFNPHHGVKAHSMRGPNSKTVLSNEGIRINTSGIVPALSTYFAEAEPSNIHSLEGILSNLVFIHRTFCLSYPRQKERFLPLKNVLFMRDTDSQEVWFQANPVDDADWPKLRSILPPEVALTAGDTKTIVSVAKISWTNGNRPSTAEFTQLQLLNQALRRSLHYINGPQTLWYLKTVRPGRIDRHPLTLTLSAMHRLSEICRYRPSQLNSFLNGQKNWLLSEFVSMSPVQFLDEVACEMTGHQIMIPNVRVPV